MKVELLISTMFQSDFSLIEKMNIKTNALIVNQCDEYSYFEHKIEDKIIKWYNVNERGLSNSRNFALQRSTGDICLLVDDDEILYDDTERILIDEYQKNSKADLIIFNLETYKGESNRYQNKKNSRLFFYNILRYGSARISFKRKKILDKRIIFDQKFGAGTDISCGEDSIFLMDALKNRLKIFSSTHNIAKIDDSFGSSKWFEGFNEKYFYDLGTVFRSIFKNYSILFVMYVILKHKNKMKEIGVKKALKSMLKGLKRYE